MYSIAQVLSKENFHHLLGKTIKSVCLSVYHQYQQYCPCIYLLSDRYQYCALLLTEAKVRDGLHLTQVPRATVDDPCVRAALLGVHHHFGPSGEGSELGPGDDTQPRVSGALEEEERRRESSVDCQRPRQVAEAPADTHLRNLVDGERLRCALAVRHQQLQAPVAVKVCGHGSWRGVTAAIMRCDRSGKTACLTFIVPH